MQGIQHSKTPEYLLKPQQPPEGNKLRTGGNEISSESFTLLIE